MRTYEPYLWTEEEEFVSRSLLNAAATAERELGNTNEAGVVRLERATDIHELYGQQARQLEGMVQMLAEIEDIYHVGHFLSCDTFTLVIFTTSPELEVCQYSASLKLSREKLLKATLPQVAGAILALWDEREDWLEGSATDVGHLFEPSK